MKNPRLLKIGSNCFLTTNDFDFYSKDTREEKLCFRILIEKLGRSATTVDGLQYIWGMVQQYAGSKVRLLIINQTPNAEIEVGKEFIVCLSGCQFKAEDIECENLFWVYNITDQKVYWPLSKNVGWF